jgi:hypothetical protein
MFKKTKGGDNDSTFYLADDNLIIDSRNQNRGSSSGVDRCIRGDRLIPGAIRLLRGRLYNR